MRSYQLKCRTNKKKKNAYHVNLALEQRFGCGLVHETAAPLIAHRRTGPHSPFYTTRYTPSQTHNPNKHASKPQRNTLHSNATAVRSEPMHFSSNAPLQLFFHPSTLILHSPAAGTATQTRCQSNTRHTIREDSSSHTIARVTCASSHPTTCSNDAQTLNKMHLLSPAPSSLPCLDG